MRLPLTLVLLLALCANGWGQPSNQPDAIRYVATHPLFWRQLARSISWGNWRAASRLLEAQTPWLREAPPLAQVTAGAIQGALLASQGDSFQASGLVTEQLGRVQQLMGDPQTAPIGRMLEVALRRILVKIGLDSARPELVTANLEPALGLCQTSPSPLPVDSFLLSTYRAQYQRLTDQSQSFDELVALHQTSMSHLQDHPLDLNDPDYRPIFQALGWWEKVLLRVGGDDPRRLQALHAQNAWIAAQLGNRAVLSSYREAELRMAISFLQLEEAEFDQDHGLPQVSRKILSSFDQLDENFAATYRYLDELNRTQVAAGLVDLQQAIAPYSQALQAEGLALQPEAFNLSAADGDFSWYRACLNREWAQLLDQEHAPWSQISQRLQVAEAAQDQADQSQGWGATTDVRQVELSMLVELRPAGWEERGRELARVALERARRYRYSRALFEALDGQSDLQEAIGDAAGAVVSLKEAVLLLERWLSDTGMTGASAQAVRERARALYERLARLQAERGSPQDALEALDRGGQMQLLTAELEVPQLARLRLLQKQAQSLDEEVKREGSLSHDTASARQQLESCTQQLKDELQKIRSQQPRFERLLALRPLNLAAVRRDIPADCCLVQYIPGAHSLHILVLTRQGLQLRQSPCSSQELDKQVERYRRLLLNAPQGSDFHWAEQVQLGRLTAQLYDLLVAPVARDLEGKSVVAFIPSADLDYVPMAALGPLDAHGQPRPLIQRKACVELAKASDLEALARPPRGPAPGLLALGNPDGSLPGAEVEASQIAAIFPGGRAFLKGAARRQLLLQPDAREGYLHLATHGVLDSRDPNHSYLVLADGDRLYLPEICALQLGDLRLVALSACETALTSRRNAGSELGSLASAFSLAGSRSVLASLWSVSDQSTCELMVRFYTGLHQGRSLAAALQQAQAQMSRDPRYSNPFDWAGFVLLGDWR